MLEMLPAVYFVELIKWTRSKCGRWQTQDPCLTSFRTFIFYVCMGIYGCFGRHCPLISVKKEICYILKYQCLRGNITDKNQDNLQLYFKLFPNFKTTQICVKKRYEFAFLCCFVGIWGLLEGTTHYETTFQRKWALNFRKLLARTQKVHVTNFRISFIFFQLHTTHLIHNFLKYW